MTMRTRTSVYYKNDTLHLMNHDLKKLTQKWGTPLYVYSFERIKQNLVSLKAAFENDIGIHYSMKSNSHRGILKKLKKEKVGVDVVSGGEVLRALECGFKGPDIIFSGVGKSEEEIIFSLRHRIEAFNVESPQELERIGRLAQNSKSTANVSFRLNPNVNPKTHPYITTGYRENKFGMDRSFLPVLLKILRKYQKSLKLVGLDFHIGSQLLDVKPFEEAAKGTIPLFRDLRALGHPLKMLDIGGGFGIPYDRKKSFDLKKLALRIRDLTKDLGAHLLCEPGRFLVGDAGVLLAQVEYVKKTPFKLFVIVNTGMHQLIRPALYQSFHHIAPVVKTTGALRKTDVVGPICESSDFLARDRWLPPLKQGDFVAICDTGAYGFVMASDYNLHKKPREILC